MAPKNMAIRLELTKANMSQTRLAELMGISKQELSIALNTAEWSINERRDAIQLIRDNA
jgi:predicted XRE-type DNA-binding protein